MGSIFLPVGSALSIFGASLGPRAAATAGCLLLLLLLGQLVPVCLLPGLDNVWHHGINKRQ